MSETQYSTGIDGRTDDYDWAILYIGDNDKDAVRLTIDTRGGVEHSVVLDQAGVVELQRRLNETAQRLYDIPLGPANMFDPPGLNMSDFVFASSMPKVEMAPIHIHLPELGSTSGFTEVTTIGHDFSAGTLVINRHWE